MYNSIRTYVALGVALLGLASCGGENYCYPGYRADGAHAKEARRETVLMGGTPQEVASNMNVPLDTLLQLNDFDLDKNPKFGDTVCLPPIKKNKGLLFHK